MFHNLRAKMAVRRCQNNLVGEHSGIKIANSNRISTKDSVFVEMTVKALELIATVDPRRFERVRHQIDYIINTDFYKIVGGLYTPGKVCEIDFNCMNVAQDPEWYLYMYAATIVHEATHGHLEQKGIRSTSKNKMRIERICRIEENRFLSRIKSRWGDQLVKPFDPEAWNIGSPLSLFLKILGLKNERDRKAKSVHSSASVSKEHETAQPDAAPNRALRSR